MMDPSAPLGSLLLVLSKLHEAIWPSTLESAVVVTLIVTLLVVTIGQFWFSRRRFARHTEELRALDDKLGAFDESMVEHVEAALRDTRWNQAALLSAWAHVRALGNVPSASIEAVVGNLPLVDESRAQALRQRPNQLMLLGLLGTVLGLSLTLGQFAPQLRVALDSLQNGNSPEALNAGLGGLLDQLKVAFVCTFWGVGAALISSRCFVLPVLAHQEETQRVLEGFVVRRLVPLVWTSPFRVQERLADVLARNAEGLQAVHAAMVQQLAVFEERTGRTVESIRRAGESLEGAGLQAARAAQSAADANRQAAETLVEASRTLRASEEATRASVVALDLNVTALREQQRAYEASQQHVLGRTDAHASDLRALLDAFSSASSDLLGGLRDNARHFEGAREDLTRDAASLLGAHERTHEAFAASLDRFETNARGLLADHQRGLRDVDVRLAEVADRLHPLDELTQRLDPRLLPADRWADFQGALTDLAQRWDNWQYAFSQRLLELLQHHGQQLGSRQHEYAAFLAELGDRYDQQSVRLEERLAALTVEVQSTVDASARRWESLYADTTSRAAGTLHGQMNVAAQMQQDRERAQEHLDQVLAALAQHLGELRTSGERSAQLLESAVKSFDRRAGETLDTVTGLPERWRLAGDAQSDAVRAALQELVTAAVATLHGLQGQNAQLAQAVQTLVVRSGEDRGALSQDLKQWAVHLEQAYRNLDGTVKLLDTNLRRVSAVTPS